MIRFAIQLPGDGSRNRVCESRIALGRYYRSPQGVKGPRGDKDRGRAHKDGAGAPTEDKDPPGPVGVDPKDYVGASTPVIVIALGKFDEYARLFSYRPSVMTGRQHHDAARAELLLRAVVHHHV